MSDGAPWAARAALARDLLARAAALLLLLLVRQRRALRLRELHAGLVVVQRQQERALISWRHAARAHHRLDEAARRGLQRDLVRHACARSLTKLGHELRLHGIVTLPESERLRDLIEVTRGVSGEHAVALDVASHVRLREGIGQQTFADGCSGEMHNSTDVAQKASRQQPQ